MDEVKQLHAVIGIVCATVVFLSILMYCRYRSDTRSHRQLMLHAPLLPDATAERLDAALKDVTEGFVVCPACAFENVMRFACCSLCGEDLNTKKAKKAKNAPMEARLHLNHVAHVVQFRATHEGSDSPRPSNASAHSLPDKQTLVLVNALEADAAVFPVGQPVPAAECKEALMIAGVDFPSRFSHLVQTTTGLSKADNHRLLKLSIERELVLRDSLILFSTVDPANVRVRLRVTFLNEKGSDAGGLLREWFILLAEQLADPATGLFVMVNESERSYSLDPHAASGDDYKRQYYAVGRILGRALLEGVTWGFHLSLPLLKTILGMPVSFDDLQFHDPSLYKNLRWLLDNDGAESLALTFSVSKRINGDDVDIDLIPDGQSVAVIDDNKREFVDLRVRYELFESIQVQLQMFLTGFYEVIPQHLLMSFDPEEFDLVLSGTDSIDVDDWEKHSKYSADLHEHPVLKWFWAAVRALPVASQRRLLHFATGSSRVPVAGFAALTSYDGRLSPFTLVGVDVYECPYIKSHSCFNRLELPKFTKKKHVTAALEAVLDGDVYEARTTQSAMSGLPAQDSVKTDSTDASHAWGAVTVGHTAAALASVGLGAVVLSQKKGTTKHKLLGRVWTGTMLTTAFSSYGIKQLNPGEFSWIHGLSTFTIGSITSGIYFARRRNIQAHRGCMVGGLVGATIAGVFAVATPHRLLHQLVSKKN
ncbi:TPA: hypothetical protein N0F65_000891 [Lagenidium giganteum]|uniref:HECT-type E3 ubiquitin transferase n=1 Tax=Lagenidium giganteum TaxID=4803 RepID=A0AAV2Z2T4_9STRA|nr:TPA: hypothetical protein N0F65_000891 [Lagenidium giganteum]